MTTLSEERWPKARCWRCNQEVVDARTLGNWCGICDRPALKPPHPETDARAILTEPQESTMADLDEKLNYAEVRAREIAAEKHFFDAAQPFYPLGFSVVYRNPGHWDLFARQVPGKFAAWRTAHPDGVTSGNDGERERAFRIRGGPGRVVVMDERWDPHRPYPRETMRFRSVMGAMLWIAEELMQEPKGEDSCNG